MHERNLEEWLSRKRKRWLGLAWVLGVSAVLALPNIDSTMQHAAAIGRLRAAITARTELPECATRLKERVAEKRNEMAGLEARFVSSDDLRVFKQDITALAKTGKCRVLAIRPGPAGVRPLDEVMEESPVPLKKKTKRGWQVEEQISVVSIQGDFAHLVEFLSGLDAETRLLDLSGLQIHPLPEGREQLTLDLHIKTFYLLTGDRN